MLLATLLSSCAVKPVPPPVVALPPSSFLSLNNNLYAKITPSNPLAEGYGAYTFVLMHAKDLKHLSRDQQNRLKVLFESIQGPFVVDSDHAADMAKWSHLNLFCIPIRYDGGDVVANIDHYDFNYGNAMLDSISRHVRSDVIKDALSQKTGPFLVTTLKPANLADQDTILFADLSDSTSETIKGLVESYRSFIFQHDKNATQKEYFESFMITTTSGMEHRIVTPDVWVQ